MISYDGIQKIKETNSQRVSSSAGTHANRIDRNLCERYGDVQAFATNGDLLFEDRSKLVAMMNDFVRMCEVY
jgi:hypothetical protein